MSARSAPHPSLGRALTALALIALVGAGVLVVAGIRAGGGNDVVLEVSNATADVLPSTVPPLVTTTVATSDEAAVTTTTVSELSPLAELLGPSYSAVPQEVAPRPQPVGMRIDSIDVSSYPIRVVGLQDNGQLEIPDETEIGWYRYGATPGWPGATVLAAHVNWRGSLGPFSQLGSVEPGDRIEVVLTDGTTRNYEVIERTMYGKLALPKERIWRNTGPEELVLITCGGEFNPEIRSYKSNIVVYAAPVAP